MQPMPRMKREGGRRGNPSNGGLSRLPAMPKLPELNPKEGRKHADPQWRTNSAGHIVGDCNWCGKETRAMGLAPIPDKQMFGEPIDGGWSCSECKPRAFGRVNGQPALALRGL